VPEGAWMHPSSGEIGVCVGNTECGAQPGSLSCPVLSCPVLATSAEVGSRRRSERTLRKQPKALGLGDAQSARMDPAGRRLAAVSPTRRRGTFRPKTFSAAANSHLHLHLHLHLRHEALKPLRGARVHHRRQQHSAAAPRMARQEAEKKLEAGSRVCEPRRAAAGFRI
jgi:hypothetical protein